jgi:LPS export ABC transporter protein LptC
MNRLWLLSILLLGLIIVFGNWESFFGGDLVEGPEQDLPALLEKPDYTLEGIQLREFANNGLLRHDISALRIDHYASDDRLDVQRPLVHTYEDQKLLLEVSSDSALIHNQPDVIIMQGQARLQQKQPPYLTLLTRNLFLYPDNAVAESQQQTRIQGPEFVINSGSFLYRYSQGKIQLQQGVEAEITSDTGMISLVKGQSMDFQYRQQQAQSLLVQGQPATVHYRHPRQPMLGRARKIHYDFASQVLVLEGDAYLQQDGQEFSGDVLRFDLTQNRLLLTGEADGEKPPVKFIIQDQEK